MGCCGCCGGRTSLVLIALTSVLSCTCILLPTIYCIVTETAWKTARSWTDTWLAGNHWDLDVTNTVGRGLLWFDQQYRYVLAGLVSVASLHLLSALLFLLGAMLRKPSLLIPWLVTDLAIICCMVALFISWSFLSFFVDLLVAMVFPMVSGSLIGLWIVMWRHVQEKYSENLYEPEDDLRRMPDRYSQYAPVPQHHQHKLQQIPENV